MDTSTNPYALVVDDDPIILMDACAILEDAGYRFFEAADGDGAKILLAEHGDRIILLFSDVEMPGSTNGFALAHHTAATYPWIEIVIASGRVAPVSGDLPDKATFLAKPFNDRMVHDHLRRTLPDGKKPEPLKKAV